MEEAIKASEINNLPFGSVIKYGRKVYWYSKGVDAPILTDSEGMWTFVKDLKWATCTIVFTPKQ